VDIKEITQSDNKWLKRLNLSRVKIERLWYRGEWKSELFERCVAIVGSRRMSRYGKQVIAEVVPRLSLAGYTIVSGLMYGIDQEAHRVALANGGKCIGVLGWGIDYDCEEGAVKLVQQIVERGGVVMSEYAPGAKSQRWMFLARNRIVAALAEMVIIVEAAEKSGTMSTAKWAKKLGKKIYAAPGSMFSDTSSGANELIASGEAILLTMKEVSMWCNDSAKVVIPSHKLGKHSEITTILKIEGPLSVNELSRKTKKQAGEILAELMTLSMVGLVEEERGVWKVSS